MNSKPEIRKIFLTVVLKGTQNRKAHFDHDESQTGKIVQQSDHDFANFILDSAGKMNFIEDMIAFEQTLQKVDMLNAKSQEDRNSIFSAQKSYEQFSVTIGQMRKAPDAYFVSVISHKDTGGDPKKIVKGNSLDYITGNITRMQNRQKFGPVSEHEIWDARIVMAKKTAEMFKTLHGNLAANFERKQKTRQNRNNSRNAKSRE